MDTKGTSLGEIELTPLPFSHKRPHLGEVSKPDLADPSETNQTTPRLSLVSIPATDASTAPIEPNTRKTVVQTRTRRIYLATLFWTLFLNGWNDGSSGPLIPVMQREYGVGFAVISLIFVVNCVGFLFGAISNVWLTDRFGFGKVMVLGAISQCITYALQSPAPPFPLFVISYLFSGFGISLQNAGANTFISGFPGNSGTRLGFLHAFYGLGAFASPLAATYFSNTKHWSFHFLISTGIALSNIVTLGLAFKLKRAEELYKDSGDQRTETETVDESGKYGQILRLKAVHLLAAFAFLYVGVEVTLGGWIVTFIIEERHGGKDAGYISSGFFGGLAVGRITLLWLNKLIGPRRVIYLYSVFLIVLEITIWLIPSLIQNAIAISFVGVLLGPMFPIIINETKALLPSWLLGGSIGWITAIGMAGSAALPFFTGLLASKVGIKALQPLVVSMMSVMVGVWALVPKARTRVE